MSNIKLLLFWIIHSNKNCCEHCNFSPTGHVQSAAYIAYLTAALLACRPKQNYNL